MEDVIKLVFRIIFEIIFRLIFSPIECYEILKDKRSPIFVKIIAALGLFIALTLFSFLLGFLIWQAFV